MAKKIALDLGRKSKLAKMMSCSMPTVRDALAYRTNSYLAKRIRYVALNRLGGAVIDGEEKPNPRFGENYTKRYGYEK